MSLIEPRPGDLWFEKMLYRWPDGQTDVIETYVLVTGSPELQRHPRGHSIPVFPVLMSINMRCITGRRCESRPPRPRTLCPVDFEKMELLSRSDEDECG